MTQYEERAEISAYVTALNEVVIRADEGLEVVTGDDDLEQALGKLAQLSAIYRVDDVYTILAQRESALLAGSLTRSLVESALAEKWFNSRPVNEAPRSATLAAERQNIADTVSASGLSVPNLHRWNNPIPDGRFSIATPGLALPNVQAGISRNASSSIESIILLPAPLVDVLGMCSHVNHTATWLTAGDASKEIGVSASPEFAAIMAQSAGLSTASIRGFNHEGPTLDLLAATTSVHDFDLVAPLGKVKHVEALRPRQPSSDSRAWFGAESPAILDDLLHETREKALDVWRLVNEAPNPFSGPNKVVNLTSALPYLAARDLLLLTIRSTFEGCSPLMAPTGARMLLEQGSELAWRFSDSSDSELVKRYQAHMDDATDRKKALENRLRTRTSSAAAIEKLLYPRGRGSFAIDTRRMPDSQPAEPPSPQEHLNELSLGVAEPNWGELAYKLLTQAAHATPLGVLHSVARIDRSSGQPSLSHEMTALSLDTACIGAALVMRGLSPLITNQAGLPSPLDWLLELFQAAGDVHNNAQRIHCLG
ncbi:hypothetical protein [Arthrobacter crystallopoietes]|uniref:Uncharacterized protein n=1 Tax=Crystallibacter crystallopoietes TaxID=37928 RepID=A0A1H0XM30_9MICC|nr:hypothetical protein [Arthrobacter crystallopoietes]SDQ03696.1 hypothetical protein SAMN04489742_0150 [Arthrobacter crystallopoietes]